MRIQLGDLVMWRHGVEALCERQHWADNWNHPSTFKFATSITRDGVIVWQAREAIDDEIATEEEPTV